MSSPFSTIEEFEGAIDGPTGGAIFTFAHTPIVNTIALLIAVGLFIWFMVGTYATHHELPKVDRPLNHLSVWIVAGLLSLVGADYRAQHPATQAPAEATAPSATAPPSRKVPAALLGLTGIGVPAFRRTKSERRKRLQRNLKSLR
ncbi:MAG: hypothetical protein HC922_06890 [Leptolyngbyaceae cyanobacterium SM2_3_12]|nr:hypothetical protein [Leptolyngbyaceae cyanobacterium SM2_3_12]